MGYLGNPHKIVILLDIRNPSKSLLGVCTLLALFSQFDQVGYKYQSAAYKGVS